MLWRTHLAAAALVFGAAGFAAAETVWVNSDNVQVREGEGAVYPIVANVSKGAQLNVQQHDRKWLEVTVGSADGFVYEDAVASSAVPGNGSFMLVNANSSVLSSGSATRGLQPDTESYVRNHDLHVGKARLDDLIADRNKLKPKDWDEFTKAGKVGPHAG